MATGFNTQVGNGEYRLQFETDNREYYLLMQEAARRCVDGKSKTNADRIRSMGDEELCKFLGEYKFCDICDEGCDSCTYNGDCDKRLFDWLKQPAE